jgi:hypothetical protein
MLIIDGERLALNMFHLKAVYNLPEAAIAGTAVALFARLRSERLTGSVSGVLRFSSPTIVTC